MASHGELTGEGKEEQGARLWGAARGRHGEGEGCRRGCRRGAQPGCSSVRSPWLLYVRRKEEEGRRREEREKKRRREGKKEKEEKRKFFPNLEISGKKDNL
jgi:hypothetical protein